ncbi:hypothetical protein V1358_16405 [Pseudoalteromonas sp. YIC-656]|uniref:hypothetical protein n=1 Tax=Pseudoalteromonas pernae TaxID=3118054 RepID=UPI00324265C3
MKKILGCALMLVAATAQANNTDISDKRPTGDIQAQILDPQGNWLRLQSIPNRAYPLELLNVEGKGCAITRFTISQSGMAKDFDIQATDPKRYSRALRQATKQLLRDWQWPEQEQEIELTMRLDYCLEEVASRSEVVEMCLKQSQAECS